MSSDQILPVHGEVAAAQRLTEGACLDAHRLRPAPSTTTLRVAVPLPVNGEDLA